jgi:hypothetical protein
LPRLAAPSGTHRARCKGSGFTDRDRSRIDIGCDLPRLRQAYIASPDRPAYIPCGPERGGCTVRLGTLWRGLPFTCGWADLLVYAPVTLRHRDYPLWLLRSGTRPLRPELAALLDVWPSSQLAECAGGRRCWRLCGEVAVLCCCIPPASSPRVPGTVLIRRPSAFQRRAGSGCRCCLGPSCQVARRRGCVVLASRCSVRVPVGRVPVR